MTFSGGLAAWKDMLLREDGLTVDVKASACFIIYVRVADTTGKQWYLTYKPENGSSVLSGEYYTIRLGASYAEGGWHVIERDLRADLLAGTGAVFDHVVWVYVRGSLCLDDLWFHSGARAQVLPPRDVDEHRFTGKETDRGTGLVYFGARYYDPEVGRWTTVDPARDGVNWYEYCYSNPLKYVDPNGKDPKTLYSTETTTTINGEGFTKTTTVYTIRVLNENGTISERHGTYEKITFTNDIAGQKAADEYREDINFDFQRTVGNGSTALGLVSGGLPSIASKIVSGILIIIGIARDNIPMDVAVPCAAGDTVENLVVTETTLYQDGTSVGSPPTTTVSVTITDVEGDINFWWYGEY